MARRPRIYVEGLSQHIHHRGNNKMDIFHDDTDRIVYMMMLERAARKYNVRVHVWTLMDNHTHQIATPQDAGGTSRMMQHLGSAYASWFNERYGRTGGFFEGRPKMHLIDTETYWYRCLRYVELNRVRAGLVATPEDYRWSSYQAHGCGAADTLLSEHPLYLALGSCPAERQIAHRALCGVPLSEPETASVRYALRTGMFEPVAVPDHPVSLAS
jgi:putative transposase